MMTEKFPPPVFMSERIWEIRKQLLTNIDVFWSSWRDFVIYIFVFEEVELPESVEEEVSKVLIHVDSQDPAVKAIYCSAAIHYLTKHYKLHQTYSM